MNRIRSGALELAMQASPAGEATEAKIRSAMKAGVIAGLTEPARVAAAVEKGIISTAEAAQFQLFSSLRHGCIMVDDFRTTSARALATPAKPRTSRRWVARFRRRPRHERCRQIDGRGGIATIVLNRPQVMNAMDGEMMQTAAAGHRGSRERCFGARRGVARRGARVHGGRATSRFFIAISPSCRN